MSLRGWLYFVIFLEGYVVLASELLAMRSIIPFVGTGTDTVAIVIAFVLMPLALGYYKGGQYKPTRKRALLVTVRKKLINNIYFAASFLVFGLSYVVLVYFFDALYSFGIENRIYLTLIYSAVFISVPVYLLGQTVPLISHYFSGEILARFAGRILFLSTVGSFMGSLVTTLVLMSVFGVNITVMVVAGMMLLLMFILSNRRFYKEVVYVALLFAVTVVLNHDRVLAQFNVVENNSYNTISIIEDEEEESITFKVNHALHSKLAKDPLDRFPYVAYIEDTFIYPTLVDLTQAQRSILIIGAGGFSMGIKDTFNRYTFVDIDESMLDVSEQYFMKLPLSSNKRFIAKPARAFLRTIEEQYDLVILDIFTHIYTTPDQLITKEFFASVKERLKPGGVVVFNSVVSPDYRDNYSIKLDNTIRSVFPFITRQVVSSYSPWEEKNAYKNVVYAMYGLYENKDIYTDNKNSYFLDF